MSPAFTRQGRLLTVIIRAAICASMTIHVDVMDDIDADSWVLVQVRVACPP